MISRFRVHVVPSLEVSYLVTPERMDPIPIPWQGYGMFDASHTDIAHFAAQWAVDNLMRKPAALVNIRSVSGSEYVAEVEHGERLSVCGRCGAEFGFLGRLCAVCA